VRGPRRWLRGWLRAALRALAVVEPREASDYASVGTSGGVAVAFNAPVAGMAYAAEEGNTVYSVAMLWKVGGTCIRAIAIAKMARHV
jgi:H+/Cl- antiporter ClcA